LFEVVDSSVEECIVSDQPISTMVLMKDSEMTNLLSLLSFGNPSSNFFFKHDIWNGTGGGGGGASALVTRARLLSRSEQVAFAKIISLSQDVVNERYCRDKDATLSSNLKDPYLPSQLPMNYNRTYICGKYTLLQCLRYPTVKKVLDHGYVSVKDIISHLLAFSSEYRCIITSDLEEHFNSQIRHISESDLGRAALACWGIFLCMEWSDDFDPATSSKKKRRSCWIKTVTVLHGYYTSQKIGESSTFPIAMGKK
jgi:hypothetical protein